MSTLTMATLEENLISQIEDVLYHAPHNYTLEDLTDKVYEVGAGYQVISHHEAFIIVTGHEFMFETEDHHAESNNSLEALLFEAQDMVNQAVNEILDKCISEVYEA